LFCQSRIYCIPDKSRSSADWRRGGGGDTRAGMQKAEAFGAHILPFPATSFHTHILTHPSTSSAAAVQQFSARSSAITHLVAAAGLFPMIFYLTSCHSPRSRTPARDAIVNGHANPSAPIRFRAHALNRKRTAPVRHILLL